jgi:hypothetical protein
MNVCNSSLILCLAVLLAPGMVVSGQVQDTNAAVTGQMVSDLAVVNILDTIRNFVDQKSTRSTPSGSLTVARAKSLR